MDTALAHKTSQTTATDLGVYRVTYRHALLRSGITGASRFDTLARNCEHARDIFEMGAEGCQIVSISGPHAPE